MVKKEISFELKMLAIVATVAITAIITLFWSTGMTANLQDSAVFAKNNLAGQAQDSSLVQEAVTCRFLNSTSTHNCTSGYGKCSGKSACGTFVKGATGTVVNWQSDCAGTFTTTIDGKNEAISFSCVRSCTAGWSCYTTDQKSYLDTNCVNYNFTNCLYGCENGACKEASQICSDSDGNDPDTSGTVTITKGITSTYYTDNCNGNTMTENICDGNQVAYHTVNCSNSCINGRCITIQSNNISVITVGSARGLAGTTIDLPISIAGAKIYSTMVYDISLPAGIKFVSTINGPAATAAGTSCSGSDLSFGFRTHVDGLGTTIGDGIVCYARLSISSSLAGSYPITISGIRLSGPSTHSAPGLGINGSIICSMPPPSTVPAIIAVGSATAQAGTIMTLPISFTPGTNASSLPQYDITLPAGITFIGYDNGPAATAAGKTCQGHTMGSFFRSIVSGGINAIGPGVLCYAKLNISQSMTAGAYPLAISGIIIASPEATQVPGIGINGTATVTA
jgi:hypothetical protein